TEPDCGDDESDRLVQSTGRRVGIISPTIKTSGHEEASRPPVRSALGNAQGLTNPGFFANRNVWSAAVSQAKNETDRLVCANVFGLQWSTRLRAMMECAPNYSQPGRELSTLAEGRSIANRRDDCGRRHRSDARDRNQPS